MSKTVHDFTIKSIDGNEVSLSQYKGKYLLIVNVASQCGFTPQYKGLEELYQELKDQVVVLGFPCNQFGKQEPGNDEEIKNFCSLNYDVKFPMFSKVEVNGENAAPLYKFLKEERPGILGSEAIKWNFTKFLVSPDGLVIKRYAPTDKPETIKEDIKKLSN
jgi:glutathione peroxidase